MKAEIIAIGTELLLGQIVNTNAQYIAQELANIGIDVHFQTVVGDNRERLIQALDLARQRAGLIICTGGLGPTQDDLTKDALADYLGRKLISHPPSMEKIVDFFAKRGVFMVESNARQALILEGSDALWNETGQAAGVGLQVDGTMYILLPGPPREMKPMFDRYAKPWIVDKLPKSDPLFSIMLKFVGIGESSLEHALIDLIEKQKDPTIAPYAKEGEVAIRLTTRAASKDEAMERIGAVEEEIRRRLGNYMYSDSEQDLSLEEAVLRLLAQRGHTLSVAESCSGGMLSDMLTDVSGSSAAFRGGVVCYSNAMKSKLLQVPAELLEGPRAPGAVSAETARALAEHVRALTDSDYALSITGVAGPDSTEGKPVGLVYIGLSGRSGATHVFENQFSGNRTGIKLRASKQALYRLWSELKHTSADGKNKINP
jgi:nicotinamide-nucleotide amidase